MGRPGLPDAVVFDFDGVICDTEYPGYEATRRVWAERDQVLTHEDWAPIIGIAWDTAWVDELERRVGPLDRRALLEHHRSIYTELLGAQGLLDGVAELMAAAAAAAVPVAVASNSDLAWVERHLIRLEVREFVGAIRAIDSVPRGKPHPDPYLLACEDVGADAARSVAIEDSHTGVTSAVAAGMFTIAVPHVLTEGHDVSGAHWVVGSLTEVSLAAVAVRFGL